MAKNRIPVGAEVKKVRVNEGDSHGVGATGHVTRYVGLAPHPFKRKEKVHGYMVRWKGEAVETMIFDDGRLAMVRSMN